MRKGTQSAKRFGLKWNDVATSVSKPRPQELERPEKVKRRRGQSAAHRTVSTVKKLNKQT